MIITVRGNTDVNINYIQTLCMVFFPGVKFPLNEEKTSDTPCADILTERSGGDGTIRSKVTLSIGEKSAEGEYCEESDRSALSCVSDERRIKQAVGKAFFRAGESLLGYTPPWGVLTGVRPSKLAAEMTADHTRDEIISVLTGEYFVNPKKAFLASDVAYREAAVLEKAADQSDSCSVYISVPFCPTRCSYCSFVSYSTPKLISLIPDYVSRLCRDLERTASVIRRKGLRVRTVYIGGGTPTILSESLLSKLLDTVASCIDVSSLEEYTLESGRPDTVTYEKLKIARDHGVDRVSINPQTLSDELLSEIGRYHTTDQFYSAFETARKIGFKSINSDVIAGLPGDNFYNFSKTFDKLTELAPENLTVHTFCVKRSSSLNGQEEKVFSRDGGDTGKCLDYSQLRAYAESYYPYYMYRQKNTVGNYENVGWTKPGHEGYYNIYMMEEIHSIYAVGAGAVTKLVDQSRRGEAAGFGHNSDRIGEPPIKRLFMPKYPYEYLDCDEGSEQYERFFSQLMN
ncbi:MAG: coproporphyrinogen dehydrogenase HemZ [Clostridia bacterium]|nr:coproporphyrinogen dehydrogenase HemZ [Clostridia bacterium]